MQHNIESYKMNGQDKNCAKNLKRYFINKWVAKTTTVKLMIENRNIILNWMTWTVKYNKMYKKYKNTET